MAQNNTSNSLQKLFSVNGRSVEIAIPIAATLICVLGQTFLTPYFNNLTNIDLVGTVVAIVVLILAEVLLKRFGRRARIVQYILLHIVAYGGLLLLLPVPNPYLTTTILINMMVYFEFGRKVMLASMSLALIAFTTKLILTHGPALRNDAGIFGVQCVGIGLITYYSVKFVHFAQTQLAAAEKNFAIAQRLSRRLESLINNVTDGVIAIDEHTITTNNNAAALSILELSQEITGKRPSEYIHLATTSGEPVDFESLLRHTRVQYTSRDLVIQYRDNSFANLLLSIVPIHQSFGSTDQGGHTIILRDITKEKSLEEERNEFISVISHELRTPIAIIEGTLENAKLFGQKRGSEQAIKASIDTASGQIYSLASIVNDLATLADIEVAKPPTLVEAIDMQSLVDKLASKYKTLAAEKGLAMTTTTSGDLPSLHSNQTYLQKILNNLLSNAIKYTDSGSIGLRVEPGHSGGVAFTVTDTGVGVGKNEQSKIFEKFYRSEDFRTRTTGGVGLGLYIVKALVGILHGTISVTSALGKGSSFRVDIPNQINQAKKSSRP